MFQDLAVLVNDQGEQLQDIESNIFVTAERTAESRDELVRAARIQRKSRRCWCWMSVIITLVLFVLFFIIFGIN
jgi:syntaxin 7